MTTRERTTMITVTTCGFIPCTTRSGRDGGARTIGTMTHGTRSGYNRGCRCRQCTDANSAASRTRRERIAERSTTSIPATRPRQRVEAITDTATWAAADDEIYYPAVPDFPEPSEPEPAEVYPRANSEDGWRYHPVPLAERAASMSKAPARKPSSSGLYGSGLFTTRRFAPMTAAPARSPVARRKPPLFAMASPSTSAQAQAQAQRAAAAKAIDDYYRRLSFYLAGKGENPDLQDARRIYGPR